MSEGTLETVFRLVALPKERGIPPKDATTLATFSEESGIECIRYFNGQRIRAETLQVVRKVYLSVEGGETFLRLCEERKAKTSTAE